MCVLAFGGILVAGCGDDPFPLPTNCSGLEGGTPCYNRMFPDVETTCGFPAGFYGKCGAAELCDVGDCDDDNLCTEDTCEWDGRCTNKENSCRDANPCTIDRCDPKSGECFHETFSGHGCPSDIACCLVSFGQGRCCSDGWCSNGVCQ
jgi:hypothetical protein